MLTIIIVFIFLAYKTFLQKILKEKDFQYQQELAYQKEISSQEIIVQENERKRIAEALHDEVGSKLNILSLWINNDDTWQNEQSRRIVSQQIPLLINATRNVSYALYPINLEKFGLIITLEELITQINTSLIVKLITKYTYYKKSVSLEVQLYRIIQEFLSNAIKHSNALEMIIQIRDTEKSLILILSDNGIGFNPQKSYKGMGVKNITSRIKSIQAKYKWKSKKNKGNTLIVFLEK
ncbi:sensor histidine kinase [Tenacibaculum agarivorans]|uniref:sensor histidine kinase n=1 Tax=Tenacibaculum agarivorans TaxID=1908389 RepID=UPI00094B9BAA|nr:ATP-binding protein [Tenacibaculum agarivorans]